MELLVLGGVLFGGFVLIRFCKWCMKHTKHDSYEHGLDETLVCRECKHSQTFRTK